MKKELIEYVVEKSHEMMDVPYCYPGAKTAAQAWLAALGTAQAGTETKKYLAELKAAVMPIDGVLAFASSEAAVEHLGKKAAAALLAHAQQSKAQGDIYCDCPACAAALAILEKESELLQ